LQIFLVRNELFRRLVNECANPDPAWIFCDDFEENRSTQYFEGAALVSNNRTADAGWDGSTAVKGAFKKGVVGAGGTKVAFGKTPPLPSAFRRRATSSFAKQSRFGSMRRDKKTS
jgi:hypothetical protein